MGALCSYGRSDKLESIERARSVSQFPDSVTKNNLFLANRQQSRMISSVQLEQMNGTSTRFLNAGIEKVDLDHIVSAADDPVPDDVTFRNTPGFFPRLLEEMTQPRPERHRSASPSPSPSPSPLIQPRDESVIIYHPHVHSAMLMLTCLILSSLGLLPGQTWSAYQTFFTELLASTASATSSHRTTPTEQVKTLYFVRHGEATHNVAEAQLGGERWEAVEALSERYFDPSLTDTGIAQVSSLATSITHALLEEGLMVDCIIVSPLTRAIESAQIAFASIWNKVPVICLENARETIGVHTCDRRRTKAELKALYPNIIFDLLRDGPDPLWHADIRETDSERLSRAARLVNFVFTLPYKHIAIVSHGGIMRAATTIMMAEADERVEWRANTLEPSEIYGYQLEKGEMLPVCAHRRILVRRSTRHLSRTQSQSSSVSFSKDSMSHA